MHPDFSFSCDSLLYPSKFDILFKWTWAFFPQWLLYFVDYLPTREYKRFRQCTLAFAEVAKDLIRKKTAESYAGDPEVKKDVMSILGMAFGCQVGD